VKENWTSLRWILRQFDWVFSKTGLSFDDSNENPTSAMQSRTSTQASNVDRVDGSFGAEEFPVNSLLAPATWDMNQGFFGMELALDVEQWASAGISWLG
jgi:hypothetical protein